MCNSVNNSGRLLHTEIQKHSYLSQQFSDLINPQYLESLVLED